MPELDRELFENAPQAAVLVREGQVLEVNLLARASLPQLAPGLPLPGSIPPCPPGEGELAGTFSDGQRAYTFRWTRVPAGEVLLFAPAPQTALTDGQLDGALRQTRTLLAELLANAENRNGKAVFYKNFHRLYRLLENLEFLQAAKQTEGLGFKPVTMDLAGLCREVADEAAPFLEEAGISLEFQCSHLSLLVPGDPVLLQRLLLELLANAARASAEKRLLFRLRVVDRRAVIAVSGGSAPLSQKQLAAILQPGPGPGVPAPGAGAGLGLTVARHIALLHAGALLVDLDRNGPSVALSLPLGPLEPRATVETPLAQRDGGLSPILVALSDVLPARLFQPDDEEEEGA